MSCVLSFDIKLLRKKFFVSMVATFKKKKKVNIVQSESNLLDRWTSRQT